MDSLRIVAGGDSEKTKANARGKLFEKIATEVLRHHGYDIDKQTPNVNYAGMEIDIEGKARIAGVPLYAECKCYATNIDAPKFQNFYAKYIAKWFKNNKAHGLFLVLPGINSHAKGFYQEECISNKDITLRLLQESDVLDALLAARIVERPEVYKHRIILADAVLGDRVLVCCDKGFFWFQYLIPQGMGTANSIQIFDSVGNTITDSDTIDYLLQLLPEAKDFKIVLPSDSPTLSSTQRSESVDEVVEVRGSSSCFEYQFPASPEFFVGRKELLGCFESFSSEILSRTTSCRGVLFEANSGWGKSSLVLATLAQLKEKGHYAIAFDSRSATSPHFLLRCLEYILDKFGDFDGLLPDRPVIGGLDSVSDNLIEIGKTLEKKNKLLVVFFDQFENVFHQIDVLSRLAQLNMKVTDAATNVAIGFSWKTDMVGLTRDFPYRWRDNIIDACKVFRLKPFAEAETNALLDKLSFELRAKLRKDLRFLISEFSQGYPWLLKKLCAHVKSQRQAGIKQADMARELLNVEQLFQDDLQGLTSEQEDALKRIAKLAPVAIGDISDEINPELIQSLVDRRLIVRVGGKYDVYWDIFRDYLNTGKLPIEEVYLLRAQVGSILKAISILRRFPGEVEIPKFKSEAQLSDGAFFNVTRDLRLLKLANISDKTIGLRFENSMDEKELVLNIGNHLKDRLPRNRCVHHVLYELLDREEISIVGLTKILMAEFPYISAVPKTWETYARVLANWLDIANLAIFDNSTSMLLKYEAGAHVRERSLTFARRRSGATVPAVHFTPVIQVAIRLVSALQGDGVVDWSGIKRSTIKKALSVLEEMKLIRRMPKAISILPSCHEFARNSTRRIELSRSAVEKWPIFNQFIKVLNDDSHTRLTYKQIANNLVEKSGAEWKLSTAETNVKIMLDWARHLGLAPGPYSYSNRGQFRAPDFQEEFALFNEKFNF